MHRIPRTAKLESEGDGKAGAVFERARVGDGLVNAEAHLLVEVGMIGEDLLGERDRSRGQDLAGVEVEVDLVDFHVLPHEFEKLV